jgi:GR25 family glycosyltransferase involved in LPS biosynthesis
MDSLFTSFCKAPWKAYCISLPRCTDRRKRFTEWASENAFSFSFWDAVDKQNLSSATVLSGNEISLGATACRQSHEALWEHCLQDKDTKYFFILEDDAGFRSKNLEDLKIFMEGILKTGKHWSVLQFGFGTMTGAELHLISRRIPPGIFQVDFCDQTHAILYTRQAIQDMYDLSQHSAYRTRPSDGLLLTYIQKKKGNVYAPRESILEQTDTISYISKMTV